MTKRPCWYSDCGHRRVHHDRQDEERGTQMVDVPGHVPADVPVYCSMTCGLMDGYLSLKYETPEEQKARQEAWFLARAASL